MFFMILVGLIQVGRAVVLSFSVRPAAMPIDTLVIALICFAIAEVIRRQNRAEGMGDEEKEVIPNRPHPLARPQRARPSVPALPSDK